MFEVKFVEKGPVYDFKRIDHVRYIIAKSYFKSGNLYYFRLDDFNLLVIAGEDIIHIAEL